MCFLQIGYEACKANQTGVAHQVLSHHNEDGVFLLEVVYEFAKGLAWLTMISFFGIVAILCSSFTALPPVQRRSGSQYARYSFSSSVIYLSYLYRAYVAMPVPATTNNSSSFEPLKDDKNLIIQGQVVRALFALQILDSIQALVINIVDICSCLIFSRSLLFIKSKRFIHSLLHSSLAL